MLLANIGRILYPNCTVLYRSVPIDAQRRRLKRDDGLEVPCDDAASACNGEARMPPPPNSCYGWSWLTSGVHGGQGRRPSPAAWTKGGNQECAAKRENGLLAHEHQTPHQVTVHPKFIGSDWICASITLGGLDSCETLNRCQPIGCVATECH